MDTPEIQTEAIAGKRLAFWRSRIGRRLLLWLLALSSLVTLVVTSVQLYMDYQTGLNDIRKELSSLQTGYAAPLGESVWNLDRRQIAMQVGSIASLTNIRRVEVRETEPASPTLLLIAAGEPQSDAVEQLDIPLPCRCNGTPRVVGVLHVEATLIPLYQNLLRRALIILASEAFKTFVTSAFLLFIVHRLVTGRLLRFTRIIRGLTPDTPTPLQLQDSGERHDEFDELVEAFNALGDRVVEHISQQHRAEAELNRYKEQLETTVQERTAQLLLARDAAEAASKAKSVFLASMSHELRTPLNAILGFSSLLQRQRDIPQEQREKLDVINRSGNHLLNLINDVLDLAKIEAGRLQLERTPFDLGELVHDVIEMMRVRAERKGLALNFSPSRSLPRYICGDEARIRQILVNLVGNAVKFTAHGSVTVRLDMRRNGDHRLLIAVEDTGIGIRKEDQTRLFKPFVQLGGPDSEGTGLGLAITRQFAELMGGTVSVESELGRGSVFKVELQVENVEKADLPAAPLSTEDIGGLAPGQSTFRILIAEDQEENQLLLTKLMTKIGMDVRVAANGEECVAQFSTWHPHLIWMDQLMPLMSGTEATHQIRALPGGQDVKIVAVTASAFQEQRQSLLDAGMDDLIIKPYRIQDIYDTLARLLGIKYAYRPRIDAPTPHALSAMIATLPVNLREDIKHALECLDSEKVKRLIQEIRQTNPQLANALTETIKGYNYTALLNLLADEQPS